MPPDNPETLTLFYDRLARNTALETQEHVCRLNELSLNPKRASEIGPIPVYEDECADSLLIRANELCPTTIAWATNPTYAYLPAYIKRYRDEVTGGKSIEIVVTTDNYCMARFFAAKELMHCFMEDDGHPATGTHPLVIELLEDLLVGNIFKKDSPQLVVDEMAWIGAMYYLLPSGWITLLQSIHDKLLEQDPSCNPHLYIAQIIRVPEWLSRIRLRR